MDNNTQSLVKTLGSIVEFVQAYRAFPNTKVASAGLSSSQLSQIKRGTTAPSLEKLFQLSEGLDIPASALLCLVEEQEKNRYSRADLMAAVCSKIEELDRKDAELKAKLENLE